MGRAPQMPFKSRPNDATDGAAAADYIAK